MTQVWKLWQCKVSLDESGLTLDYAGNGKASVKRLVVPMTAIEGAQVIKVGSVDLFRLNVAGDDYARAVRHEDEPTVALLMRTESARQAAAAINANIHAKPVADAVALAQINAARAGKKSPKHPYPPPPMSPATGSARANKTTKAAVKATSAGPASRSPARKTSGASLAFVERETQVAATHKRAKRASAIGKAPASDTASMRATVTQRAPKNVAEPPAAAPAVVEVTTEIARTRQPWVLYLHLYAAARSVMRLANVALQGSGDTQTYYKTNRTLTGSVTRQKEEPTNWAFFLMLVSIVIFAVALVLYAVGFLLSGWEKLFRKLFGLPMPAPETANDGS